MSRNSDKLNTPPPQQQEKENENQTSPQIDKSNPFGLSFVVPTEDVLLPTEGKFYPSGNPLCGVSSVEIKHMTAKEEDLLSGVQNATDSNVFNVLINNLLTNKSYRSEDMIEEDKLAILLRARSTGYGKFYSAELTCESCNATMEHDFDLTKVSFVPPANVVEYEPEKNTYKLTLPVTKLPASVRLLTDKERSIIEREEKKKKDLNIPFNRTVATVIRMLVTVNDIDNREAIEKLVDVLPAADAKKILNFNDNIFPRISTKQEVTCGTCDAQSEREVPLTWAFFRIDI